MPLLVAARPAAARAQAPAARPADAVPGRTSSVLRLPGKTVEVLGLKRWTIAMLEDSLARYAPGESLGSHACAAILRYRLGFPDAAAITYDGWPGDTVERVVVALVEPQDSARVRYRTVPMDSTAPYAPWTDAILLVNRHPGSVQAALFAYLQWRRNPALPLSDLGGDTAHVRRYMRFLGAHAREADYATALRLLEGSRDYRTRVVAASVLLNFVHRDRAVHALVNALTESDGMVKGMAGTALSAFATSRPRPVRWGPVAPTVHALLDGTSLFELSNTLRLLTATGASRADARPFLRGGGEMVLAYLGAVQPDLRDSAHQLLVALKGDDLGLDPAPWRAWIATL